MFSVVLPAYNSERFIDKAIESVLMQTYTDFELIIVDDGSTDGTRQRIASYTDKRIRCVYQENGGVSAARNKGILESKGDFVCFLDSDDSWKTDHLAEMDALIQKFGHCGLFITGYDLRLNNGEIVPKSKQILKRISEEQSMSENGFDVLNKNGYFFNTNTMCCKREVFQKVGLFEVGVKNGEDDDLWYRIFAYYPIAISKKATTVYDRANCGATATRLEVTEPYFMRRVEGLLNSPEVLPTRKEGLRVWVERNKLSRARQNILQGRKAEAFKLLRTVSFRKSDKKRYFEAVFCLLIPTKLVRKRIDQRDAGYYN